jgi:hypothetical protein
MPRHPLLTSTASGCSAAFISRRTTSECVTKAEFNGIVLSRALADKPVLFDTLGPGDVFDLFDAIAARLCTIT